MHRPLVHVCILDSIFSISDMKSDEYVRYIASYMPSSLYTPLMQSYNNLTHTI